MSELKFRLATKEDSNLLSRVFTSSAPGWAQITVTPEKISQNLFSQRNTAEVLLAESTDGDLLGYVLFCGKFYTYSGDSQIYLQDMFVAHDSRGQAIGLRLMHRLAQEAVSRGCSRIEWFIDEPDVEGFYAKTGAKVVQDRDLRIVRLEDKSLENFARDWLT